MYLQTAWHISIYVLCGGLPVHGLIKDSTRPPSMWRHASRTWPQPASCRRLLREKPCSWSCPPPYPGHSVEPCHQPAGHPACTPAQVHRGVGVWVSQPHSAHMLALIKVHQSSPRQHTRVNACIQLFLNLFFEAFDAPYDCTLHHNTAGPQHHARTWQPPTPPPGDPWGQCTQPACKHWHQPHRALCQPGTSGG